jgi:hypothetical protein
MDGWLARFEIRPLSGDDGGDYLREPPERVGSVAGGGTSAGEDRAAERYGDVCRAPPRLRYASRAFKRGAAKSRNARTFSGRSPWPAWMRLTGQGGGSNASSTSARVPARIASATW